MYLFFSGSQPAEHLFCSKIPKPSPSPLIAFVWSSWHLEYRKILLLFWFILCLWREVVGPNLVPSYNWIQKFLTLFLMTAQKLTNIFHALLFMFIVEHPQHPHSDTSTVYQNLSIVMETSSISSVISHKVTHWSPNISSSTSLLSH